MKSPLISAVRCALLSPIVALAACSTGPRIPPAHFSGIVAPAASAGVRVNGQLRPAAGRSLLEILLAGESARRIGLQAPVEEQPLVLIDGVKVSQGIQTLASTPAFHVAEVEVLGRVAAAARYGNSARYGAIVITTR